MTGSPPGPALAALEVPSGAGALSVLPRLRAALDGSGPALVPHAAASPPLRLPGSSPSAAAGAGLPTGLAVVVGTSGSTGSSKLAMLTADALRASAEATHRRLGGPGRWALALPAQHIAGLQVLVRSLVASTAPVAVEAGTATAFAAATARLRIGYAGRCYTALVPTQLVRLLADPVGAAALRAYDAVLVGAAATPPAVLAEAARQDVRVVTTYGMSETAGGCVYDGVALDCSTFAVDADGRITLGGRNLAAGYLGRPDLSAAAFVPAPGGGPRSFRTDDVGSIDQDGRLVVEGRVDDLIGTGGLKVAPRLVEQAVTARIGEVAEAVVVGVPDPVWGQRVGLALVLVPGSDAPSLSQLRDRLRDGLPAHALPTLLAVLPALPQRGPGKPDRAAVLRSLQEMSAADGTMGATS